MARSHDIDRHTQSTGETIGTPVPAVPLERDPRHARARRRAPVLLSWLQTDLGPSPVDPVLNVGRYTLRWLRRAAGAPSDHGFQSSTGHRLCVPAVRTAVSVGGQSAAADDDVHALRERGLHISSGTKS